MTNCKRYVVLMGLQHQHMDWTSCYQRSYDEFEEAKKYVCMVMSGFSHHYDWFEIIDLETMSSVGNIKKGFCNESETTT